MKKEWNHQKTNYLAKILYSTINNGKVLVPSRILKWNNEDRKLHFLCLKKNDIFVFLYSFCGSFLGSQGYQDIWHKTGIVAEK